MKTPSIIILALVVNCFTFWKIDMINLSGKWDDSRAHSSFSLNLTENRSGHITGSHISVQDNGNRIDSESGSGDITITGNFNPTAKTATVTFISGYCNKKGKAIIRKINARQIVWKITKPPAGEYYIPDIDTLTKE